MKAPYYEHAGVTMFAGDCRRVKLPEDSLNCIITSPPYWGLRDYGVDGQIGLERTPGEYIAKLVKVFRALRAALRNDGTAWVNIGDCWANDGKWGGETGGKQAYLDANNRKRVGREKRLTGLKPKDLVGIPWMLAFALRDDGWYLRSEIIWHKPNPMPESVTDRPTKAHEQIFLLTKSPRYFYDATAIAEKTDPKNSRDTTTHRRNPPPGAATDSGFVNGRHFETRNKRDVWTVSCPRFTEAHFATFPPDLIQPCVLAGCPEGETVFDPFMGAGTTALVAKQNGRKFIGIELNPEYIEIAAKRIAQDVLPLEASTERPAEPPDPA